MKLHIGCSNKYLKGWKHADIKNLEHIDYVVNLKNLKEVIGEDKASHIYACHVLEHFSRHEVDNVLMNWKSVLKPGGILRLSVPDIEAVVEYYNENKDLSILRGLLWGGQRDLYDYHKIGFDYNDLKTRLESLGFKNIKKYDWRDFLPEDFDDYSRSYLPHMDFKNGKLMSLNITAEKI